MSPSITKDKVLYLVFSMFLVGAIATIQPLIWNYSRNDQISLALVYLAIGLIAGVLWLKPSGAKE